jgi:hypothetical protein
MGNSRRETSPVTVAVATDGVLGETGFPGDGSTSRWDSGGYVGEDGTGDDESGRMGRGIFAGSGGGLRGVRGRSGSKEASDWLAETGPNEAR